LLDAEPAEGELLIEAEEDEPLLEVDGGEPIVSNTLRAQGQSCRSSMEHRNVEM
jgi:hypothetical protein